MRASVDKDAMTVIVVPATRIPLTGVRVAQRRHVAKLDSNTTKRLEEHLNRPITDLEAEILGLLQNHTGAIMDLQAEVQTLKDYVSSLMRASLVLKPKEH